MSSDSHDEGKLTHLDDAGAARMVDVGDKEASVREAVARALLRMKPRTRARIFEGALPKGDVLGTARIAGIQAAKRTPELIPLCHQIALTSCEVTFEPDPDPACLYVTARARARDRTGVEMEALTAAAVASLTVYDMVKAIDRGVTVELLRLTEKHGGKTGSWVRS